MKGQYLTVEYVFFFAIGVAMIIAVYFTFSSINSTIRDDSAQMQLTRTGELIRGTIIRMYDASKATNSSITYDMEIPTMLSNCVYMVTVNDNLMLNCTGDTQISSALNLYGINITSKEILYSTKGFIRIESDSSGVMLK